MGLFDSFSTDILGGLGSDVLSGSALGDLGGTVGTDLANAGVSQLGQDFGGGAVGTSVAMAQPVMSQLPAIVGGVTRWASRFPNLWQALQKFRANRIPMTIDKLYGALKRFGPAALAQIVGAAAVADLITYKATHKTRRMNPANTRALRRSLRRLKSFDKLAHRVQMQLSRASSKGGRRRTSRCGTCRKSPCAC